MSTIGAVTHRNQEEGFMASGVEGSTSSSAGGQVEQDSDQEKQTEEMET